MLKLLDSMTIHIIS